MSVLSLFHEFAFYVLPHGHSSRALILSDHAIFPAAIVRDSFRQELREFHPASDIPQGISTIRPQGFNKSGPKHDVMSRDAFNKMFGVDSDKVKVVLGAGQINTRKGLDLFVQTARKVIDQSDAYDWRFIWVGGKFDVKKDPEHALYLDYFLRVHTIGDFVFFVPHQDSMDIFFTCADVFFLSSRLDPYPNVVLDAIESETPALVFRDATGFGPIIQDYEGVIYAVGYGDVEEAARALVNIIENPKSLAKQKREELTRLLSFETYVDDVRACLKTSQSSAKKRERLCETLEKKSYRELLDMAGALPNYLFREYAVYDKEEYIIRLSSFLSKLDTTKTKFGDLPDSSHVCNASFEDRDLSSSHTILCFSDRAELIQDFLELYGVLGMKFIVGENYKDLKGDKAENISVLSGPSSDFASFLSNDSLDVNGKNVAILNLSAFSLDLCSSVNNLMLGLISGRCENFMAEYPECDGIMPADNRFYDAGFMTPDATAQCGYFKLAELRHALELALNRQKTPRFDVYEFMKNFISNHFIAANLNPWLH
ncbi:MAG: glycosyltransferase family 4 protein [Hyphomonadaceae bacterium]|nr:glycosyltransferase family 4 protein [Hyphomonadaceae bacterium]